jgi:adenosylcobinamide-GDP ribazoletransferase
MMQKSLESLLRESFGRLRHCARWLTRIPLGRADETEGYSLAASAWGFPVVGALVGLGGGVIYGLGHRLGLPAVLAAIVSVIALMLATGGLHEDGLADFIDGLGGSTPETRLAIMRDSRVGSFGVMALILGVALRVAALTVLAATSKVMLALIVSGALARSVMVAVMYALPLARRDGQAVSAGHPSSRVLGWTIGLSILLAVMLLPIKAAIIALLAAGAGGFAIAVIAKAKLGGSTGDVLGAAEQTAEVLVLLALVAMLG